MRILGKKFKFDRIHQLAFIVVNCSDFIFPISVVITNSSVHSSIFLCFLLYQMNLVK